MIKPKTSHAIGSEMEIEIPKGIMIRPIARQMIKRVFYLYDDITRDNERFSFVFKNLYMN